MKKPQDTDFQLQCGSLQLDLSSPVVMGILNVTPDSFYDGGKYFSPDEALKHALNMVEDGAAIIDIGAVSTRPGAAQPSAEEEWKRLEPVVKIVRENLPDTVLSVDTYRSKTARKAVDAGVNIINDISGGTMDNKMFETVAGLDVPYVLMHIKGTPETMQEDPVYENVVQEVKLFFEERVKRLQDLGFTKIILDPGFGFGKTVEHNYHLLNALDVFAKMNFPVLAGLSRKSMITRMLGVGKNEALNATSALNTIALQKGAKILRVHDVKEAVEVVRIYSYLSSLC